jgi:hypothetical protein
VARKVAVDVMTLGHPVVSGPCSSVEESDRPVARRSVVLRGAVLLVIGRRQRSSQGLENRGTTLGVWASEC